MPRRGGIVEEWVGAAIEEFIDAARVSAAEVGGEEQVAERRAGGCVRHGGSILARGRGCCLYGCVRIGRQALNVL